MLITSIQAEEGRGGDKAMAVEAVRSTDTGECSQHRLVLCQRFAFYRSLYDQQHPRSVKHAWLAYQRIVREDQIDSTLTARALVTYGQLCSFQKARICKNG
jgi:hypothetical protein